MTQNVYFASNIAALRSALRTRGYPEFLLPEVPYDAEKRASYLEKFKSRNLHDASRSSNAKSTDLLVFKIPYSEQARKLSIRRRVKDFVSELRTDIGADFLNQVHVVVAHPVQENLFTRTCKRATFFSTIAR